MVKEIKKLNNYRQPLGAYVLSPKRLAFFLVSIIVFTGFAVIKSNNTASAAPGINSTINFQGKVVNSNGTNVADGQYQFVFRLYDVSSGGTHLWTETQSNVQVTGGVFRVSLGSVSSLSSIDFNSDSLYLGINFNSDGEMTPRIRFASVPYAFNAEKVAGLTVTNTTGTLTIPDSETIEFGGSFTTSAQDLTLTLSGATSVTLPTTGTLATLAGSEILTNKSIGSTGLIFSGASTDITTATDENLVLAANGTGNVLVQAQSGGQAALIVDKTGNNDLFTASASGVTRFVIDNSGSIKLFAGQSIDTLTNGTLDIGATNATTLTLGRSGMTIYLPGYTTTGGLLYTSSGVLNQISAGGLGECLISSGGGAPGWGSCAGAGGTNWDITNGIITPKLTGTLDFLVGGNTTESAQFAVLGINDNAPVATLSAIGSGNGVSLTAESAAIQSLLNKTLTLGGSTTGDIAILENTSISGDVSATGNLTLSSFSANGGLLYTNSSGTLAQLTSQGSSGECLLSGGAGAAPTFNTCPGGAGGGAAWTVSAGTIFPNEATTLDLLVGGTSTVAAKFAILNVNESRGNQIATLSGDLVLDKASSIQTTNLNTLTLGGATTGNIIIDSGSSSITFSDPVLASSTLDVDGNATFDGTNFDLNSTNLTIADDNIQFDGATTTFTTTGDLIIDSGGGQVLFSDGDVFAVGGVAGGLTYNVIGASGTTTSQGLVGDTNLLIGGNLEVNGVFYADGGIDTTFTNNGGVIYTGGTGVMAQTGVGNLGECLVSQGGGAPTWQSCSGAGGSNWDISSGVITPKLTNNLDFLLGGNSTASAKFSVLNISGGTPVASVSAGSTAAYLTGDGILGTTALSQLSIGGSLTGDIVIDSQTDSIVFEDGVTIQGPLSFEGSLTVQDGQFIGLGESGGRIVFTNTATDELDIQSANVDLNNNLITNIGNANTDFTSGGGLNIAGDLTLTGTGTFNGILDANGVVTLGDNGDTITLNSSDWDITSSGVGTGFDQWIVDNIDLNGQTITFSSTTPSIVMSDAGTLTITDGSNTLFSLVDRGTTGAIVMPNSGVLSIGGSGSSVAYNVFGDSTTGAYVTDLDSDDDVFIEGNLEVDGTVRVSNQTLTFPTGAGSSGYVLTTNGSGVLDWTEIAGTIERWAETDSALRPLQDTWDFLIGGSSTASAKFAFINVNSGTPTASISGNLTLNSAGVIQTTNSQTLTIGGSDTGNIVINPKNGKAGGYVAPAIDNVTDLGASTSGRFRSLYVGPTSLHVQCLTGDGCGQDLDYEIGVDTADNGLYIGINGNGIPHKALSITEGGSVDVLGAFSSGTADAFQVDTTGNVVSAGDMEISGTTGLSLLGVGADLTFANLERITNDSNGVITLARNDTGTVTLNAADNDATAALTIQSGGAAALTLDTGGGAALNLGTTNATSAVLGNGSLTSFTVTTDGTGDSEVVLPTGSIGASEILDDALGFSDLANTLALDATTTITPGTSNLVINLDSSGDFILQDATTPFVQFLDDGTITLGKSSAGGTINIGTGTGVDEIYIGTGATGADIITIGNAAGTIALTGSNFDLSSAGILTMGEELILSAASGEGISGGGLSDCDAATDILQWDSTTNQFSCGTIPGTYQTVGLNDTTTESLTTTNSRILDDGASQYLAITPANTSSDILINVSIRVDSDSTDSEVDVFTIYRTTDGTTPVCDSSTLVGSAMEIETTNADDDGWVAGNFVDSPNTTNEVRYTVCGDSTGGTASNDTNQITLTLTEVGNGTGGGGGGIAGVDVRESDGAPSVSEATTIEFGPATSSDEDFVVTDQGSGVARVTLGSQVARLEDAETVTGGWTFNTVGTTFTTVAQINGGLTSASGTNLSVTPGGTGDLVVNLDADTNAQFTLSAAPTADIFTLSNSSFGTTTDAVDGLQIDFETASTIGSRTNAGIQLNVTSGATEVGDTLYGINIGNLTSASSGNEVGLNIGTSWDTAIVTNNGNINAGSGTITASTWDGLGAVGLSIGSGDITGLSVTTDGTGDGEVSLPAQSIGASEIVSNTITTTQISSTLTFADADFIDLSTVVHDDSTAQGLRLPQNTSLTSLASGEGFIAYNTTSKTVQVFNGSNWISIAGASVFDDIYDESVSQTNTTMEINNSLGLTFDLTSSGNFNIQDSGTSFAQFSAEGTITLGKSAATSTINLGTGTAADSINIGTDSTSGDTIVIGNSHASNALSLLGGDYSDWYVQATGAAKFNTFAGAGLYDDCSLGSSKIVWNSSTQLFECGNDNDSGGSPELQSVLGATTDGTVRDSDNYTVNWNWDFTSVGVDAGLNITESSASTDGTQDQQALVRLVTLSSSTASPFQVTAGGTDVGDVYFNLSGTSDFEIRDAGAAFASFLDDTTISLGANSSTFSVDATNIDISTAGTLTLYGTTDITTDANSNLVIASNGTGDISFITDGDSTFSVTGLTNCDTIDTDSNGKFTCGTDTAGGGTGSLDDSYNNGGTITVDAYDVLINLNDASNDFGFVIDASVDGAINTALEITTTGGASAAFTTAIDVSDAGIGTALAVGDNAISGGSYSISASTALTLGLGTETIGINSSDWDISTGGDLTGIGSIATDGNLTFSKQSPVVVFDASTATDTDYWAGVISDAGNDDDDFYRIGKGTTPGSNILLTMDTNGYLGLNVAAPIERLDVGGNATVSGNLTFSGGARTIANRENATLQLGDSQTGLIQFYSASNYLNSAGNLVLTGTVFASTLDAQGASAMTIGSGDVLSLTVTTNGTGDSEVVLPNESISTTEITNDSLTPADFAATMIYADADFIDLSSILHNDSAHQGLRLPQNAVFSNPSSGEGFIAWNTTGAGELQVYNGSSWIGVGSSNFDQVYAQSVTDADLNMAISDGFGLVFDMTSSGNFSIRDGGTDIAVFGADGSLALSPNGTSDLIINVDSNSYVGIGTGSEAPLGTLDVRGSSTTVPGATISATTDGAGLTVDNGGDGDLLRVQKLEDIKFQVLNSGDVQISNLDDANCDVKADGSGVLYCGDEIGSDGVTITTFENGGGTTWTKSNYTGLTFTQVIVTGGGGGGGEGECQDTGCTAAAGGGGGGGTAIEVISASSLGTTETVTIGAGGAGAVATNNNTRADGSVGNASSFGSLLSASGGNGGSGANTATNASGAGGSGGVGSNGDINLSGSRGTDGASGAEGPLGGMGGGGYWGPGSSGGGPSGAGVGNGVDAAVFGGGGGGGAAEDVDNVAAGGAGGDGVVVTMNYTSSGGDLAEWYEVSEDVEAGDVVSISQDNFEYDSKLGLQKSAVLKKAVKGESVVGVVSTVPFETMGSDILSGASHPKPIALAGRVPVKVSLENGEIKAGDLLAPSSIPGFASKAVKAGITIGRALEDSNCIEGEVCKVLVIVNSSFSNGALLKEALEDEGIDLNSISEGVDIGKILLAKAIQENKDIRATEAAEFYTDRVIAGLEVITPRLVSQDIVSETLSVAQATVSGTLTVDVLRANRIDLPASAIAQALQAGGLEYLINNSTSSAATTQEFAYKTLEDGQKLLQESMASLSARLDSMGAVSLLGLSSNEEEFVTVNNFASFGTTTLADVSVLETLRIGTSNSLTITGNSIDAMSETLSIQALKLGNIEFLGGAITFQTDGKAIFSEDVEFRKNVTVAGVLSASTVSVTDLLLGRGETKVISDDEVEATAAAGLVVLKKEKDRVRVNNPLVKDSSFIFITPKTGTSRTLFLLEQHGASKEDEAHFVVGIDRENNEDIKFNYLIVN